MSNSNDNTPKTVLQSIKDIFGSLKKRKYLTAIKEFFLIFKNQYLRHLKGKYVEIKVKRIPRTLIALVVLVILMFAWPHNTTSTNEKPSSNNQQTEENVVYNENGIKIYDLRKCDIAACGTLENDTNESYEKITIIINFHDATGKIVYEGGIDVSEMAPLSRIKIKIPSDLDFAYLKLNEVLINPEEE